MSLKRIATAASFMLIFATTQLATAGDYVWARSAWGNGSLARNYSGMNNGYGGYYVPKNAYGNNHESRRPFTNPTGYIVPNGTAVYPTLQRFNVQR